MRSTLFMLSKAYINYFCAQARSYLSSEPIAWIASNILCTFMQRRLQELHQVQLQMFKVQPDNYAVLTSVTMHLMRNIAFPVTPRQTFLREALRDLGFDPIIDRFGMFFLHDFRKDRGLLELEVGDDEVVRKLMGVKEKKRRPAAHSASHMLKNQNTDPSQDYPLGERPTWSEVQDLLKRDPLLLIQPFTWTSLLDIDLDTSDLIIQFTQDLWLALSKQVLSQPIPEISTLKEAMEMWSAAFVKDHLTHVTFLPNSHQISTRKRSSWPFRDLFSVFFLDPDAPVAPKSVWATFHKKGYLHTFKELKRNLSASAFQDLTSNIRYFLGKMQCLPYSVPYNTKNKGRLWRSIHGTIEMLTNTHYYKLEALGNEPRRSRRAIRANAHPTEVLALLGEVHLGIPVQSSKKQNRKTGRSARSRNKRKPPATKPRTPE